MLLFVHGYVCVTSGVLGIWNYLLKDVLKSGWSLQRTLTWNTTTPVGSANTCLSILTVSAILLLSYSNVSTHASGHTWNQDTPSVKCTHSNTHHRAVLRSSSPAWRAQSCCGGSCLRVLIQSSISPSLYAARRYVPFILHLQLKRKTTHLTVLHGDGSKKTISSNTATGSE